MDKTKYIQCLLVAGCLAFVFAYENTAFAQSEEEKPAAPASPAGSAELKGIPAEPNEPLQEWTIPDEASVLKIFTNWLDAQELSLDKKMQASAAWSSDSSNSSSHLPKLLAALAVVDERAETLTRTCQAPSSIGTLPTFPWLFDPKAPAILRTNGRLYFGQWLAREGYFDEALKMLDMLSPEDVVDPVALLFYRAAAQHRLVDVEACRKTLAMLLMHEEALPLRYQQVASLMLRDVSAVKEESLDHIARRMDDIHRRLDKGRVGEKVQQVEQGVLDSLDKLIEKLEDEAKRRQQQQQAGNGQGGTPMDQSRAAKMQAAGRVDRKAIGHKAGWGDLPDKEREKAMQDIAREFPSHYREVIEQYFRKLATEEEEKP